MALGALALGVGYAALSGGTDVRLAALARSLRLHATFGTDGSDVQGATLLVLIPQLNDQAKLLQLGEHRERFEGLVDEFEQGN